jgi:CheY-like chemotaxis protein
MRILAVDDEPNILELLKVFLEADGNHQVVTAASGAAALAAIETAGVDFDCLLLDIQMPEMNGLDLCERIRALPDYAHVPIIMLTAMSQKTYIDKAFSVGATDYVTKPFDFLELRGRLSAASRILQEYHRACDSVEEARRLIQDIDEPAKPHIDEPLSIDGVDRLVGYAAFENYVLALSRSKLLFASAFAVKVLGFKPLHDTLSARNMRHVLKTVGKAIVDQLPGEGNVVSYRGNGVFLCFNQKKTGVTQERRMVLINQSLATEKQIQRDLPLVQVAVGQEVSLGSISRSGAFLALRRAVEAIETQPIPARELAELSKRVLRSNTRSQEQFNLERRAYELILQDIVRDERRQVG